MPARSPFLHAWLLPSLPPSAPSPVASLLSVHFRIPPLGLLLSIAFFSLPSGWLRWFHNSIASTALAARSIFLLSFSCLHALCRLLFVSFFAFLTGDLFAYADFLTRSLVLLRMVCTSFMQVSTVYSRLLSTWMLAFFFWLWLCLVPLHSFALYRPASLSMRILLRGYSYGSSLLVVPSTRFFFSLPLLSCEVHYPLLLLLVPVPPPSSLLLSPLLRVGVPLLPSYFSFSNLPALSSGGSFYSAL